MSYQSHLRNGGKYMKILNFKCSLKSDVIISQKAATVGNQSSLDFIPGSNFLGIAANDLYAKYASNPQITWLLFHSGKVRFGDAHPLFEKDGLYIRTLRIPAAMFYPKLSKPTEECYVYHHISDFESLKDKQLKQCRSGFYALYNREGIKANINKTFAIKSAYDPVSRRSEDQKMYGYESIGKDTVFTFEVVCDEDIKDDLLQDIILSFTTGNKRIGRSRTAQYGLVEIEYLKDIQIQDTAIIQPNGEKVTVYAESRLIFLDEYGVPSFKPTAQQLGFSENSTILWNESQIRTFQYAPWNYIRQSRDTDRCGIEKGSVFVVKTSDAPSATSSTYLGYYQNEGFGKVIYNPEFLSADCNGTTLYRLKDDETLEKKNKSINECSLEVRDEVIFQYLKNRRDSELIEQEIYQKVDTFIQANKDRFISDKDDFAAQWGQIRAIASTSKTKESLKESINRYLTRGIAKDKWIEHKRHIVFKSFMESLNDLNDQNTQLAIINLASEMAKICSKK